MEPQARRRRLLEYLYRNRTRPVYNGEISRELGQSYRAELDYLRDKGKVEFQYLPDSDGLFFDVRITAVGIDEIERGTGEMEVVESGAKKQNLVVKTPDPKLILESLHLHPKIKAAAARLFADGHYASCILEAYKVLNSHVKIKSGRIELDGKSLMAEVFSPDSPILALSELRSRSEMDEQQGFMFLYMGAMIGIRNPKAHEVVRQVDCYRTIEYLAFASLLARRVDEAKKVR